MVDLNRQLTALEAAANDANSRALLHGDQHARDEWTRKALAYRQAAQRIRDKQIARAA